MPLSQADVDLQWSQHHRAPWFAPALAEDWIRAKVFPFVSRAPPGSPRGLHLDFIHSSFAPFEEIRTLHSLSSGASDLALRLAAFPSPTALDIDSEALWNTAARLLFSINIPSKPRPGA